MHDSGMLGPSEVACQPKLGETWGVHLHGAAQHAATVDSLRLDPERRLVRPARLERATSWFVARRSIQLS